MDSAGRLYVANFGRNEITVFDSASGAVLATIAVETDIPVSVAVTRRGQILVGPKYPGQLLIVESGP